MISLETLLSKVNSLIASGNLTAAQLSQLSAIQDNIDASKMSVANIASLPAAEDNTGRLIYVVDQEDFYYSDGGQWTTNFSTVFTEIGSIPYAWGGNADGIIGDGTTIPRSSPVTVVGGITNWSQVSVGSSHTLGVTATGIAYAWGNNFTGQLGVGSYGNNQSSPVTVAGGITNWSQVSAGDSFSLGVTDTGIAYAWGQGTRGQLGINLSFVNRTSPVTVVGGITNWSQVSAGSYHSLGLTSTGIAYAWGYNYRFGIPMGLLADGTPINRSSPVTIVGGITNWSQLSAGIYHSLGVTDTGIAYAWGYNYGGLLGNGDGSYGNNQSSPVTVVGGITNWSQVSAGRRHSLGVTDTGIAYAWGENGHGQLGNGIGGFGANQSSPVTVVGGITNWSQLSAAVDFGLGVTTTGVLYAWGRNYTGQLGTGDLINRSSPVTVVGGITTWSQISTNPGFQGAAAIANPTKGFNE